jgi:hypothetical protein
MHFAEGHWTSSDIPPERFIGPAVVIDVSDKAAANSDYMLTPADIAAWEAAHGRIADGSIVLLRTGWSARWPDKKTYLGDDTPGDASHLHFPSFGAEAAALLVNERHALMARPRTFSSTASWPRRTRAAWKSDKPRSASADGQHRRRAADQDRRRIGRSGADYRARAEVGGLFERFIGLQNETTGRIVQT